MSSISPTRNVIICRLGLRPWDKSSLLLGGSKTCLMLASATAFFLAGQGRERLVVEEHHG